MMTKSVKSLVQEVFQALLAILFRHQIHCVGAAGGDGGAELATRAGGGRLQWAWFCKAYITCGTNPNPHLSGSVKGMCRVNGEFIPFIQVYYRVVKGFCRVFFEL